MSIVVKLGSSTLVDDEGRIRSGVIDSRVRDLVRLVRQGLRPVLVSSGAVASGMGRLGVTVRPSGLPELQALAAVGQGVLFQRYLEAFGAHGILPAQVLLTSADLARRSSYLNARNTLVRLLELGVVPIINENDTTATDELTFGDNDVLAAHIAVLLGSNRLLLLTDRAGLYADLGNGPELVGDVPHGTKPSDLQLAQIPGGSGRGGIASKIAAASMAREAGVTCVIASGRADGVIAAVASGHHIGTRFGPAAQSASAFKLWLRYAKPSCGQVIIDSGAVQALCERGTSLLPVGVVDVVGGFQPGDAVDLVEIGGQPLGKGIASMGADEVRRVRGLRSDAVMAMLPGAPVEVIHRDQLVLAEADEAR